MVWFVERPAGGKTGWPFLLKMKTRMAIWLAVMGAGALGLLAAQLSIGFGTTANDNTGDTLRTFAGKAHTNFTVLFGQAFTSTRAGVTGTTNNFTVTNTFSTAFSAAPVVLLIAGTNELPHLISVSTSNFIAGAATTNAIIRWFAMPAQ